MARKLSISRAWDESRAILARDGKLFASVALALMVLPATIAGVLAPPSTLSGEQPPSWAGLLALLIAVVGLAGQIAVTRLALGPATSVGEAISHGFRRILPAFAAALLFGLALAIVLVPLLVVMAGEEGLQSLSTSNPDPSVVPAILLLGLIALLVGVRFQLIAPVATAEPGGPIRILKRSWELTKGSYWRLLAFLLLCLLVMVIVVLYFGQILGGILVKGLFGDAPALSVGALVAALIAAVIQAVFTTILAVMLARIYAQLAGAGEPEASVPSSGT